MSDDLTARITEALARRVSCGATGDRYLVGGEARPLLVEARDEITRLRERLSDSWYVDIGERLDAAEAENARLREGIEAHRTWLLDDQGAEPMDGEFALWAALDVPSTASPVRDGTNTEQEQP